MHEILKYLEAKEAGPEAVRDYEKAIIPPEAKSVESAYLLGWYRQMLHTLVRDIGADNVRKLYAEIWPSQPQLTIKDLP